MLNALRCIDQRFAFENSGIFVSVLDFQLEQFEKDNPELVAACKIQKVIYPFFGQLIQTYSLVVELISRKSGDLDWISAGCWNLLLPLSHFTWHWASQKQVLLGQKFAAALLPRLFGTNPRSHHKGATGRVRTGDQLLPVLCNCQLGQDIPFLLLCSL